MTLTSIRPAPLGLLLVAAACPSSVTPGSESDPRLTEETVRACARFTGCFDVVGGVADPFSGCVLQLSASLGGGLGGLAGVGSPSDLDEASIRCLAEATSCDEAGRCINGGEPATPCDFEPRCEDDVLRQCNGGVPFAYDCAAAGEQCLVSSRGVATCGLPGDCPERTSVCLEGDVRYCFDDVSHSRECGDLDCLETSADSSFCADTSGASCEPGVASARCDGDLAVNCPFGFEVGRRCESGCRLTSDGALCEAADYCRGSTCDGTTLVGCFAGEEYPVDCLTVGATTCDEVGSMGARCRL